MSEEVHVNKMGRHLILDFSGVENVDLNSFTAVDRLFKDALNKVEIQVEDIQKKEFVPQGLTAIYMLRSGHLTIHSWPESKSCAIDFYHSGADSWNTVRTVEECICDALGWQNCSSTVTVSRGGHSRLYCNENSAKCEILHHVSLVHREKTPFQELRVYDTKYMGRILLLDGQVQISDEFDDNYTIDMSKEIVKEGNSYNHILIIGGGDMLIANYLLENFETEVKKITVCEIDERVVENVRKYFKMSENINAAIDSGRLNLVFKDGAEYAKSLAEKGELVDGIIVDCTDVWLEDGVASSLFTVDFYKALNSCMNKGARFSQQLSFQQLVPQFKLKWEEAGFTDIDVIHTTTPEYGEDLPIANVGKS